MKRLHPQSLAFLIVIIASTFCFAIAAPKKADPLLTAVDISTIADGDYVLTLKAGVVTLRPFKLLTPGNSPTPTPTPTPVPNPLNERAKLFQSAASSVAGDSSRADTARELAFLYSTLSDYARPPTPQVTDPAIFKAIVSLGTTNLLAAKPDATQKAWQPFRDAFGTQWTILNGKSAPIGEYAKLLDDASAGLNASAPEKALDPAKIQAIIEIILAILKLFGL